MPLCSGHGAPQLHCLQYSLLLICCRPILTLGRSF
jgi:hypothetical protein